MGGRASQTVRRQLRTAAPLRVAGVIDIDGPLDLEAFMVIERQICGAPVVEQLLGGEPATLPARYREASATGLLPIASKQELLIASRANESWIGAIRSYAATAEKAGDSVVVTMLENSGHFDGLNPKAPAWSTVLASVRSIIGPK